MKWTWRNRTRCLVMASLSASLGVPSVGTAQAGASLSGRVVDQGTEAPVADVEVWIDGVGTRITETNGSFSFANVPRGDWVLTVRHVAFGVHWQEVKVGEEPLRLTIRLTQTGITLAPLVVEAMSREGRRRRAAGRQLNRVSREEIRRYEETSMTLVELLTAQVPGVRISRSGVVGQPTCLEFRGARSGNFIRGLSSSDPGCNSPEVYLDGVLVRNPATLYASLPIEMIENIEVVQPSEAGARFGTGSMWGALIIETRRPGIAPEEDQRLAGYSRGPRRYDWSQEPVSHQGGKVLVGAALGNIVGLAAGVAIASRCISFRGAGDSLVSDCSATATMGAGVAAVGLPALGSALGARIAGSTEQSRGKLAAALIGTGVVLIPAYGVAMSGEHNDSNLLGTIGIVSLTVGVPLIATLADRLFRSSRTEN